MIHYYSPCTFRVTVNKWWCLPGFLLFFSMLFLPTAYQSIKAVLLAIVLAMIFVGITLNDGKLNLHWAILFWTLLIVMVGSGFMLLGAVKSAPGALRVGTVYVLWPLVYTVLLSSLTNWRVIDGIFRVLVFSTIAIALYSFSYLLNVTGWLPDFLYIRLDQGQAIGWYNGFVEYNLYSISSLLFLLPFLVAAVLTWPKGRSMPVSRFWLWVALLLSLMAAIMSGRRSVWMIIIIAPFITLLFWMFLSRSDRSVNRKRFKRVGLGLVFMIILLFLYLKSLVGLDIMAIVNNFLTGFAFGRDISATARSEQFFALIKEWANMPLFGAGHGASVSGSIRSAEYPWAYELSYIALLFHTGLVGFFLYASSVIWIFWIGLKIIKSRDRLKFYILPVLVGTSCFLIGNATNPYLEKFDCMWVIFLPVALINYWLLRSVKSGKRTMFLTKKNLIELS